jgi:hypothetical protein
VSFSGVKRPGRGVDHLPPSIAKVKEGVELYLGLTGEWRKLHKGLIDLCSSPNIIQMVKSRRMRQAGHVANVGEKRVLCRVAMGKPEVKRTLGRPRA